MKGQLQALKSELIKNKHSSIVWVTFISFALAPIMGGVFMLIMSNPEAMAKSGAFHTKAQMINFSATWDSYLDILKQAIGVGGF